MLGKGHSVKGHAWAAERFATLSHRHFASQEPISTQGMQGCIIPQVLAYMEEGVRQGAMKNLQHAIIDEVNTRGEIDNHQPLMHSSDLLFAVPLKAWSCEHKAHSTYQRIQLLELHGNQVVLWTPLLQGVVHMHILAWQHVCRT